MTPLGTLVAVACFCQSVALTDTRHLLRVTQNLHAGQVDPEPQNNAGHPILQVNAGIIDVIKQADTAPSQVGGTPRTDAGDLLKLALPESVHEHPPHTKAIFVVRTHGRVGTRFLEYYAKALSTAQLTIPVWCVYDKTSQPDAKSIQALETLAKSQANFHVFTLTDADLKSAFPGAKWVWKDDHVHWTPPIGYYQHTPSILLLLKQKFAASMPEFVWVIEDDTFFTGNVAEFVRAYDNDNADYLGKYTPRDQGFLMHWQHWEQKTFQPSELGPKGSQVIWKAEHVERYSQKLLGLLDKMIKGNKMLYGEIFGSTVCNAVDWCNMGQLPMDTANGVGDKHRYCFNCALLPQDVLVSMQGCGANVPAATAQQQGSPGIPRFAENCAASKTAEWVHAVKWIKDDNKAEAVLDAAFKKIGH